MSDDVIIPRETAKTQPRLRDEVASVLLDNGWTCEYHEPDAYCGECRRLYAVTADAVLAVVRKHYREPSAPSTRH